MALHEEIERLVSAVDELDELARSIQTGHSSSTSSDTGSRRLTDDYQRWLAESLAILAEPRAVRFRQLYEGTTWTAGLKEFLADPLRQNVLYDPSKPGNPLTSERFQHPWGNRFHKLILQQRQLLIEELHARGAEATGNAAAPGTEVFVVHGHNDAVRTTVVDVIGRSMGRRPTVLFEQPNRSGTIVEKLEAHASDAGFAVVLLTADDLGRSRSAEVETPRARQNVILEAGYFMGRLSRQRVALLYEPGVELPSDLQGILYIELDSSGTWAFTLGREMRAAGLDADLNRL